MTAITTDHLVNGASVCYRHPHMETGLRCNKCNRPMCVKCAKRSAAVGCKCAVCVRGIQDTYFNGKWLDYLLAALIALPLSLLAGALFTYLIDGLPFSWFITFLAAPVVAGFITETVHRGLQIRRSRYLRHVVVGCFVAGIVPFSLFAGWICATLNPSIPDLYGYGLIEPGILFFIGVGAIMARLR